MERLVKNGGVTNKNRLKFYDLPYIGNCKYDNFKNITI